MPEQSELQVTSQDQAAAGATTNATAELTEPCCCHIVLVAEKITVDTTTGLLTSIVSDHVLLEAKDCSGNASIWPESGTPAALDSGEHAEPGLKIAAVMPSGNDCRLSCSAMIKAVQVPILNQLIDEIKKLLSEVASLHEQAARAATKLKAATDRLGLLKVMKAPQQAIAQAAIEILTDQQLLHGLQAKISDLMQRVAKLIEISAGTNDTMMIEKTITIDGYAQCGAGNWLEAIVSPPGWKIDPNNANRATLSLETRKNHGRWFLDISATRVCPPGH